MSGLLEPPAVNCHEHLCAQDAAVVERKQRPAMPHTPDIAVLWKKPDGTSCVLSKRETTLILSLRRGEKLVMEKAVESPREAMELAAFWKTLPNQAAP